MQVNYPCSIVIDWLSIFGKRKYPDYFPNTSGRFQLKMLPYGTKLFKRLFTISFCDDYGEVRPFGSIAINPTYVRDETLFEEGEVPEDFKVKKKFGGGLDEDVFLLKIDNQFLYEWDWFNTVLEFFTTYSLEFKSVSRVDLAADFQFLKNRVSGPQLVHRLKNMTWWKCGNTKCTEVYKMPYSIKFREKPFYDKQYEDAMKELDEKHVKFHGKLDTNEIFLSPDEIYYSKHPEDETKKVARNVTESMTFGTHASLCQVQIYNKSAELRASEVDGVCKKEYIRRLWQERRIDLPHRDVWRIELRFSSKAEVILRDGSRRPISIWDLEEEHLKRTFLNAVDSWFRIVDTGCEKMTQDFIRKWASHKSRMKIVQLFDGEIKTNYRRRKYSTNPNRFLKAVMNALSRRAGQIDVGEIPIPEEEKKETVTKLHDAVYSLQKIYGIINDKQPECNQALAEFYWILQGMNAPEAFPCDVIPNIQTYLDFGDVSS